LIAHNHTRAAAYDTKKAVAAKNNENTIMDSLDTNVADLDRDAFAALFDSYLEQKNIKEHTVVSGRVIAIEGDWVTVDVGYKAEGNIPKTEFYDEEGNLTIEVGQDVDVYLDAMTESDGTLVLSKRRADQMKAWEEIEKAFEAEESVNGVITSRVKGGLSVDIGVKAFLPGSQVDLRPVKNLEKLLGVSMEFKIIKFNKRRGNIVLSRRVMLEEDRKVKRSETLKTLEVEAIMIGVVKNITDYGAFIDLGGIDGLLHITDMTYGRINHPSEMVEVGRRQPTGKPWMQANPARPMGRSRPQIPCGRDRSRTCGFDARLRLLHSVGRRNRRPRTHFRNDMEQASQAPLKVGRTQRCSRSQGSWCRRREQANQLGYAST
jgi:transcriptional accessory protein Tex/SPT6